MKKKFELSAVKRTVLGKKVKHLRLERKIPANVFGNTKPTPVTLDEKQLIKTLSEAGETALVELHIEGEEKARPILFSHVDRHPISGNILHVDLQQVNLTEKVTAHVPLELVGESEAVKAGGVLLTLHDEIEVEALPSDLPEKFVLDISVLKEIGKELKISDLSYDPSKVELKLGADEILVVVQEPKVEEEPVVVAEPVEVETTVQGAKKEEGEEGEAGADAKAGAKPPAEGAKPAAKPEAKAEAPKK